MSHSSEKPDVSPAAKRLLIALGMICFGLIGLEFIIHRHAYFALEGQPMFFVAYGFVAFIMVVVGGVGLRKLVMRAPDYYEAGNDDE